MFRHCKLSMYADMPKSEYSVLQIAKSPRICFLSGLTGEEMMMFIDAFPETGILISFSEVIIEEHSMII